MYYCITLPVYYVYVRLSRKRIALMNPGAATREMNDWYGGTDTHSSQFSSEESY
jgi:hypothetical protein